MAETDKHTAGYVLTRSESPGSYTLWTSGGRELAHVNFWAGASVEEEAEAVRLFAVSPKLLAACRRAARSNHHPACPIARGAGPCTVTHDDCTCHVGAASAAIAEATWQSAEAAAPSRDVIISVVGGVPALISKPNGVRVLIRH